MSAREHRPATPAGALYYPVNDAPPSTPAVAAAAGTVLLTLASGQFLMTLDSTSRPPRVADEETWH